RGGREIAREALAAHLPALGAEDAWRRVLHDGFLPESGFEAIRPELRAGSLPPLPEEPTAEDAIEVCFRADSKVYDGRYAGNGWLQELPDPVTKLTWDNAALLSPRTAERLGVGSEDVIEVRVGERAIEIAVYVLPGHAEGSMTIPLGYGRDVAGRVGEGAGSDAFRLRTTGSPHATIATEVRKTGRKYRLASTQDHHAIDTTGRHGVADRLGALVREADLETYRRHPDFAKHVVHHPPLVSLWEKHEFEGHAWGMTIDLTSCIGCGACSVACQSENNVPIVGKEQVLESREMHWLRIDRYFSGDPDEPEAVHQPMACVHCWNAPCESVCPVSATTHSEEGLNQMVYNRCIGTRYCSNNCPYKVRRFNWFNFNENYTQIEKMVKNPEVTVRARGVMEKCTYCVQRIEAVKIDAKNERRAIEDGEIVPACAQACPTQAIVFGDLADPDSRVRKLQDHNRSYGLLAELNTQPRTLYLAKLRNPAGGSGTAHGHDGHDGHGEGGHE
ncbi:MAG: 4Fe-4S dicluster domain-containing protein, partial [Candidatus Eisenbacteria bacterium]|nr:4Fe-4S dicluster domain-containing protein [Candidatus Latescibacterota bacterium]MBD3302251.1 4Fe-4S dicluster domain-containing protein [Candidatus Eisenbacteria bacterium]